MAGGPATGTTTSLLATTLGPSGGVAAGLSVSGGLGVALPCASAKRSRLFPEKFDDCEMAIIRAVNETVFAQNFLETGGTVDSESCEKVGVLHIVHGLGITCSSSSDR